MWGKEIYNFIAEKLFLEDKLWIVTLNALMYMEYIKGNIFCSLKRGILFQMG